jgi:hypothetical protein
MARGAKQHVSNAKPKTFKSFKRAFRRGHLRWNSDSMYSWVEQRSKKGKWLQITDNLPLSKLQKLS